jgi:DNA repair protein RecN (Recombination protein N)
MTADTGYLANDLEKKLILLNQSAYKISKERHKYKSRLEKAVTAILNDMGMPKAEFVINIAVHFDENGFYISNGKKLAGDQTGFDKVEFEFCANPGEDLKPLAKIASGGEISRVMLAIKNAFVDDDTDGCEIFDEIDVGISGEVAAKVGKQLKKLTQRRQVICITHLHQIASLADSHYKVFKEKVGNRTVSRIKMLTEDERVMEIASLLSGEKISESAIDGAKELLNNGSGD